MRKTLMLYCKKKVCVAADRSENKTTYKVATIVRVDVATDVVMYINELLKRTNV